MWKSAYSNPCLFSSVLKKNKNNINNKNTKLPSRPLSVFPKKTTQRFNPEVQDPELKVQITDIITKQNKNDVNI